MTKKQEELLDKYIARANNYINYIAVDGTGTVCGYEKKPKWVPLCKGYWHVTSGEIVFIGSNKKLINVAKESLRPLKQIQKLDNAMQSEEDFDLDDFLMKEKLSRFSQKERLKQIKDFKPSLIIHNDEFKGECYDLEEYQKEFSLIEDLFAIRFYYINKKRNAVGFQIFIEDDGNFYLWNSDNGGVHTDWIPKLYLLIKKADKMINYSLDNLVSL